MSELLCLWNAVCDMYAYTADLLPCRPTTVVGSAVCTMQGNRGYSQHHSPLREPLPEALPPGPQEDRRTGHLWESLWRDPAGGLPQLEGCWGEVGNWSTVHYTQTHSSRFAAIVKENKLTRGGFYRLEGTHNPAMVKHSTVLIFSVTAAGGRARWRRPRSRKVTPCRRTEEQG